MRGPCRNNPPRRRPAALTMVEAVVSIAVVGTMLAAALGALGSSARVRRSQAARCLGANLARQLMAEILQAHYAEPAGSPVFGPEAPEAADTRAEWDDVDDYHGWSACPPQAKDGTPLVGAAGWTRQVTVEHVRQSDPTQPAGSDEGLKRVTVSAISPDGKRSTLRALRSHGSLYDQRPATQTTYVGWIAVDLQVGPDAAARVSSGTHLLNLVPAEP